MDCWNSSCVITGTSSTSAFLPSASAPFPPAPSGNPLWGSRAPPQTDVMLTAVSSVQGSGVRGGVGQLTRRWPTRDGHILRATTPEGVSPIIGPGTLPLQTPRATRNGDPWPAPGFPSQSPKRSDRLGTKPLHHDTVAGPRRGVMVVVEFRTSRSFFF